MYPFILQFLCIIATALYCSNVSDFSLERLVWTSEVGEEVLDLRWDIFFSFAMIRSRGQSLLMISWCGRGIVWGNVRVGNYSSKLSVRGNVRSGNCPFGEMSGRGIFRSGKCPVGNCPVREMSVRGNVRIPSLGSVTSFMGCSRKLLFQK